MWSGTTLLDLDGETVDEGEWAKQDIRDALNYGIPLPGGWVGYHGIMAAIDPLSIAKNEWKVLLNHAYNVQDMDGGNGKTETSRVCDLVARYYGNLKLCNTLLVPIL